MDTCFVVMPVGVKPRNDGSSKTHDYDKVYRVLIKRAIDQAGMKPLRADESTGSRPIHSDMFKDLRDRPVVLVDLSRNNANVLYELGVRHVMAPRGTVLICSKGTELPFDVKLSRTIFYEYDGENLDWEEVERVVPQLQSAIEEAQKGASDSPVHALLERVMSSSEVQRHNAPLDPAHSGAGGVAAFDAYQKLLSERWRLDNVSLDDILRDHGENVFGVRAIAWFLCLNAEGGSETWMAEASGDEDKGPVGVAWKEGPRRSHPTCA